MSLHHMQPQWGMGEPQPSQKHKNRKEGTGLEIETMPHYTTNDFFRRFRSNIYSVLYSTALACINPLQFARIKVKSKEKKLYKKITVSHPKLTTQK